MKVLFAVSNDNITTSVVGKYQQKFKEIITSKNVYYFNAIIKELQRDKTYDAVVIGEDLEPFSNNNYESVDKFIFEKLDNISDEASKPNGDIIPIVLICSDRRTKSDELLKKIFGISIYNALLGNDRSIDMVCNLIYKPRSKKEAKNYYQIDSADELGGYEPEVQEAVSEQQIQNIINYYKKIGNNEKKCAEAFDSISGQYNDTQLRIIVKFLPMSVKAILESASPRYQQLMTNGTVLSNGKYNQYQPKDNPTQPKNLDLLTRDLEKPKLTKPVIIPSAMNITHPENVETQSKNNFQTGSISDSNKQSNQYASSTYQQSTNPINGYQSNEINRYQPNMYGTNNNTYQPSAYQQNAASYQPNAYAQNSNSYQPNAYTQGQNRYQQNPYAQNSNGYQANGNTLNPYGVVNENNLTNQNVQNQNSYNPLENMNLMTNEQKVEENRKENIQEKQPTISKNETVSLNSTILAPNEGEINHINEENIPNVNEINNANITNNLELANSERTLEDSAHEEQVTNQENQPRRRGRPRKIKEIQESEIGNQDPNQKKRRGRPRKIQEPVDLNESNNQGLVSNNNTFLDFDENNKTIEPSTTLLENEKIGMPDINNTMTSVAQDAAIPKVESNTTLPGFEEPVIPTEEPSVALPGFEEPVMPTAEPSVALPGFEEPVVPTVEPSVALPGFEETVVPTVEPSTTLPGFEEAAMPVAEPNPYGQASYMQQQQNEQINNYAQPVSYEQTNNYVQHISNEPLNNYTQSAKIEPNASYIQQTADYQQYNNAIANNQNLNNQVSNNVIAGNGKIVAFVGTTKNGTSFIVNNLAQLLSQSNVRVAIVDLTKNKNAYYMFTNNDAELVKQATTSMYNLSQGVAKGLNVNKNLTVYTTIPDELEDIQNNVNVVISTLSQNYDVVLLDCDFKTDVNYFVNASEMYLVQTMDALTIQPLTQFLSELKTRNLLDESKLRVIINKYVHLKRIDDKMIIAGMSRYNEPSMTLQRDLFNRNTIKYIDIPFEEQTYARYLEEIALCQISLVGYSQNFLASLEQLKNMVYPLVSGNNKNINNYAAPKKHGFFGGKKEKSTPVNNINTNSAPHFSGNVDQTLNKMRSNY